MEKIGTNQGWSNPATDEAWQHGYPQEFQDFMESIYPRPRTALRHKHSLATRSQPSYAGYLSAERGGAEVEIPS